MRALPPVDEAQLDQLSDLELARLEDQLRLEQELDTSRHAQLTVGRVIVFLLSLLGIALAMGLVALLRLERLGPLGLPLYFLAFGLGIALGHGAWRAAGYAVRNAVRWVLGHWPVVVYLLAVLARLTGR